MKSVVEDTRALGDAEDKVLLTVSAKDEDQGDNAKVIYTIIKGNEEGKVDFISFLKIKFPCHKLWIKTNYFI